MTRRKKRQLRIDQQRIGERYAQTRQRSCGNKNQYNSNLEALAWGRLANERYNQNVEWKTYFCKYCYKWHLTSNKGE